VRDNNNTGILVKVGDFERTLAEDNGIVNNKRGRKQTMGQKQQQHERGEKEKKDVIESGKRKETRRRKEGKT